MSSYLTSAQVGQILRPINRTRVYQRDGMAYVEAYEIRAHMARIYGVARWSSEVIEQHMICEEPVQTKAGKPAWYVAYRSIVKITVYAPDGTYLATYSEGHAGDSTHPTRGEAHGNAITNSESYAFKRAACMALLDQGGLSLYGRGDTSALVKRTLVMPEGSSSEQPVDHDAPPVVAESAPDHDTETPTSPVGAGGAPVAPPTTESDSLPDSVVEASPEDVAALHAERVAAFRQRIIDAMQERSRSKALQQLTRIGIDLAQAGLMQAMSTHPNGTPMSLAVLQDEAVRTKSRAAEPEQGVLND